MSPKTKSEVDGKLSKQMSSLIELLTTSGKPKLNPEIMKKFKKICRTSDAYVNHAYDLLMMQLTKNHSEIRLSTFQMIDELFNRSHAFRLLILQDFETLMELTVGTDRSLPIPKPKVAAKAMKIETCKSIQQWHEKFQDGYPKLVLGFEFLKANKKSAGVCLYVCRDIFCRFFQVAEAPDKVDFDEIHEQFEQERQIKEDRERKLEQARKDKVEKAEREMNDGKADIELVVTEVENGLELLMPHPENFFIGGGQSAVTDEPERLENNTSKSSGMGDSNQEKETNGEQSELLRESGSDDTTTVNDKTDNSDCPDNGATTNNTGSTGSSKHTLNGQIAEKGKSTANNTDSTGSSEQTLNGQITANSDDEEEEEEEEDEEVEDYGEDMRGGVFTQEHGILSHTFEITVDMGAEDRGLKITDDNADIVQDVREKYKLVKSKYINYVKRWIQVMTDCNGKPDDIKGLEALKVRLDEAIKKCLELDIISSANNKSSTESDSEDDFEDVPEKEGYEEDIPEHIKLEAFAQASSSKPKRGRPKKKPRKQYWMLPDDDEDNDLANDPTTLQSNLKKMAGNSKKSGKAPLVPKIEPGTSGIPSQINTSGSCKDQNASSKSRDKVKTVKGSSKEELFEQAPVKSFGVDLEHWENPENIEAPLQVKYEGASRFWVPDKDPDESGSQEHVAALTMRTMTYTGEFEPVRWKCRAPLPDGRLCERMDRNKCPFHGKVIPRDEIGQPTDPEDIEKIIKEDLEGEEEEASTSTKGKSPAKGKKKGKKRKYPNLTDIKEVKTSRQRLESKIFKKSTLKRVNQCLDAADVKKATDKFSNQFNYALK